MTITVVPQSADGNVADANSYITAAYFTTYHTNRGNDVSAYTADQIAAAIIKAWDYLDTRFSFRGVKLVTDGTQTTEWPRKSANNTTRFYDYSFNVPIVYIGDTTNIALVGPNGETIEGIPESLKKAQAEYSFRALTASLFEDAPAPSGGYPIESLSQKVDVIEQSFKYGAGGGGTIGGFVMPAYPAADLLLVRAGLIVSGRTLVR